jgi:hypothetical protein
VVPWLVTVRDIPHVINCGIKRAFKRVETLKVVMGMLPAVVHGPILSLWSLCLSLASPSLSAFIISFSIALIPAISGSPIRFW